jgi:hypothetical protein
MMQQQQMMQMAEKGVGPAVKGMADVVQQGAMEGAE